MRTNKFRIIFMFLLLSCSSRDTNKQQQDSTYSFIQDSTYSFINVLSDEDLELLKGVNSTQRGTPYRTPYRFNVRFNSDNYNLPIYDSLKNKTEILNPEFFDVYKYAQDKGIDSSNAYNYVHSYSDRIVLILDKIKVYQVASDPTLGDFIFFYKTPQDEVVYLEKNGNIYHDYWKDFFANAEAIKEGWYKKKK